MYRATTPTHTFTLEIDTATLVEVLVTYKQRELILNKHYQDGAFPDGMSFDGEKVIVKLTQEETKQFIPGKKADVQLRALTSAGDAMATKQFQVVVNDVLNDEVLS